MFRSLAQRNYRIYAAGSLISNIGTWLQTTAQAWLVLELTGSGFLLGVVLALQLIPTLLFSPIAGVLADRMPKRRLLAITQLAMAVPSAILATLAIAGVVQVWHVIVLATLFGLARSFEAPARQSFVPEIVDRANLPNAVALNSASFNTGRLIGPAVAGLMIAALGGGVFGTGWVILLNAFSYGASILALYVMDGEKLRPAARTGSGRGAVREGIAYVRGRPDLVLVFSVVFFLGAFGMNFQIISALMATEEFGKGATEFGILGTVLAIGSLTGSLLAARRNESRLMFIVLAGLGFAAVQITSGLMPTYVSYMVVLPLVGLAVMTVVTTANAMIQLTTSPQMRGRVASLYLMVFLGSVPLGAPIAGWMAEQLGPRAALFITAGVVIVGIATVTAWYLHKMHLSVRVGPWRRPRLYVTEVSTSLTSPATEQII